MHAGVLSWRRRNDGAIKLWAATGELLQRWRPSEGAIALTASPSGVHVAAGTTEGVVYILPVADP
jgi:hypothetical protein